MTQVWSFHGLAGFYSCFAKDFGTIAAPLNELTKKGVAFHWGEEQEASFALLKDNLTHTPLLVTLLNLNVMLVELALVAF